MQTSKFKVLLYLKKSKLYKSKQAPIMKWVTYEQTIAQFSYKFSCDPKLWNAQKKQTEQREPKGDGNEWQVETLSSLGTVGL